MAISSNISARLKKYKPGSIFGYKDLKLNNSEFSAAAKTIERLKKKGIIKSLSPGVFYKPVKSVFGELRPSEDEILKSYLFKNGKREGYITGLSLFNSMMLTTQIPRIIKIAYFNKRVSFDTGSLKIESAKSYVNITDDNYNLLQLLDVLKDFNKIPDLDRESAVNIITSKIKMLSERERKELVEYSFNYPPRTRAFLGSILENTGMISETGKLKLSINPLSEFKVSLNEKILPTVKNWNIK